LADRTRRKGIGPLDVESEQIVLSIRKTVAGP